MNAIAVKPKTVVVTPARTAVVNSLTWRTMDDTFGRKLSVVVNNVSSFAVEGEAYDTLGQWTDETIKGLILARYGLELAA